MKCAYTAILIPIGDDVQLQFPWYSRRLLQMNASPYEPFQLPLRTDAPSPCLLSAAMCVQSFFFFTSLGRNVPWPNLEKERLPVSGPKQIKEPSAAARTPPQWSELWRTPSGAGYSPRTWLNSRYQINQHRPKLLCCQWLTLTHRLTLKFTWSRCLSETRIRWFFNVRIEIGPMSNQQSINKLTLIRSSQLRPSNKT